MRSISPAELAPPFARYSHGIEIPAGYRTLRTAGQLAVTAEGAVPETAEAQARLCFGNIASILAEGGMQPSDVFHVNAFVTDRAHMAGYMVARDDFLADVPVLPTSTLLIVTGFTRPEFLVEVEVWAAAV